MPRNRKETSTSEVWCAVPGCTSDARKSLNKYPWMRNVHFLPFPTLKKNPRLRAKWLQLIRRTSDYTPKPYHRVCSRHFIADSCPRESNALPELFPWNGYGKNRSSTRDATSILKRESHQRTEDFDIVDQDHSYSLSCIMKRPISSYSPGDKVDTGSQTVFTGQDIQNLENTLQEYEQKFEDKDKLIRETFVNKVLKSDNCVKNLTGLPTLDMFNTINDITTNFESKLKYWTRNDSANQKSYQNAEHKKTGPSRKLNKREELLLTLIRLKLALPLSMLSILFGVSSSTVSSIFTTWIFYLFHIFQTEIIWPSKELVVKTMPMSFKKLYPRTRAIIDCTEIFIQRPRNPSIQAKTYSSYKSHNTFKCLVSITPTGAYSFVSQLWGGNCSDRFITMNSWFLDLISPGDEIMADRGFTIADLLLSKRAYLTIPPFTRKCTWGKGRRLNAYEIKKTRQIANLRIHVERAIGRLKSFRLISQTLPWTLKPVAYQMVVIACFFCNLLKPLVKK